MLAEGHRRAAEGIEKAIVKLQPDFDSGVARVVIESAWGAAFHWIAFGCETKHQQHKNDHSRLGRFLRDRGEKSTADSWESLDLIRQGGWYGSEPDLVAVQRGLEFLAQIRLWATQ